jgi:putative acetyltransferase
MQLYPTEVNQLDSADDLAQMHVRLLGAFEHSNLLGCGAVKRMPGGYGEIKRMYVSPHARGKGVGTALIRTLEAHLVAANILVARLETGIHSHAALALYRKCGYEERSPFGNYRANPYSIYMEKRLSRA